MLDPEGLASQLFDTFIVQSKGNPREAAQQVIMFLSASLVHAISAVAGDEAARKTMLKTVGESIIGAPPPPPAGDPGKL